MTSTRSAIGCSANWTRILPRFSAIQKTAKPLRGIRVLVTRPAGEASEFVRLLEERGARVTSVPLIQIGPAPNARALQAAVDRAETFAWVVFTSAVGVDSFVSRRKKDLPAKVRIAAIGPATADAVLESLHRKVDGIPKQFSGEALADEIVRHASEGDSMLIVAAQDARPALGARLRAAGFFVETIAAYTTIEIPPPDLLSHISQSDVITLASPSAVRSLIRGLGLDKAAAKLRGKLLACIGPVTLLEARQSGLHVEIVPRSATLPALVDALCSYYTMPRA